MTNPIIFICREYNILDGKYISKTIDGKYVFDMISLIKRNVMIMILLNINALIMKTIMRIF